MWYTGYLLLLSQCIWAINAQQQQSAIRCFGTGFVMDASCPANHKMFPVEVLVGSVARSTGCPDNLVKGVNTTAEALCCSQADSGCLATYRNTQNDTVSYIYHVNCMGKQTCTSYPVVRSTTSGPVVYCVHSIYHVTTTLMELKYQCIADDQFLVPTTASGTMSGLYTIHIVLQDYADSGISPLTQKIQCSVETSECDGQMQIVAKDLRLFSEGGQCYQNLIVNETSNNAIETISCSNNTNFIQNLNFYISQTNHIILTFLNSYNQSGGYLWIQLVPVNASHTFNVSCPPVEENPQCFPTTTESPTTVQTTISNPSTSIANSSNPEVEKKEPEDDGDNTVLIVSIVVPLIAVVAIVILVCKKLKGKSAKDTSPETAATDRPQNLESATSSPSIITESQIKINSPPRLHHQLTHTPADSKSQLMLKSHQEQAEVTNQETPEMLPRQQQQALISPNMFQGHQELPNLNDPRMRQNRLAPIQRDNPSKKPKKKKKKKNKVGTEDEETNDNEAEDSNIVDIEKSWEEMTRNKVKENETGEPTSEEGEKRKKKRKKQKHQTDDLGAEGNEVQAENDDAEKPRKKKKKHRKPDSDQNDDMNTIDE